MFFGADHHDMLTAEIFIIQTIVGMWSAVDPLSDCEPVARRSQIEMRAVLHRCTPCERRGARHIGEVLGRRALEDVSR